MLSWSSSYCPLPPSFAATSSKLPPYAHSKKTCWRPSAPSHPSSLTFPKHSVNSFRPFSYAYINEQEKKKTLEKGQALTEPSANKWNVTEVLGLILRYLDSEAADSTPWNPELPCSSCIMAPHSAIFCVCSAICRRLCQGWCYKLALLTSLTMVVCKPWQI